MSTLYLDRKGLEVKLDGAALALYEDGVKRGTVPVKMLEKVVVHGNIRFESRLLCALGEHQVDVLFLSGRNSRLGSMAFSHRHNDARRRLAQYSVALDTKRQAVLAGQLIVGKVEKQASLLSLALERRADLRKAIFGAQQTLTGILEELHKDECSPSRLRGLEGAAAAAYFNAYKQLFAPSLGFEGRRKRPPPDPVNACLSLGYTMLHFEAVSVCHVVGLDPLLGFYHEPSFGRESLACDLIEPLRPRLDALVWQLFRDRLLKAEHFYEENGGCFLNKAGRKCFYAKFEGFVQPVRRLLRLQGHKLARHYLEIPETLP